MADGVVPTASSCRGGRVQARARHHGRAHHRLAVLLALALLASCSGGGTGGSSSGSGGGGGGGQPEPDTTSKITYTFVNSGTISSSEVDDTTFTPTGRVNISSGATHEVVTTS